MRGSEGLVLYWLLTEGEEAAAEEEESAHKSIPSIIYIDKMAVKDTTGRKAGSTNYCFKERMHFLSIMELVLPIGPDEWSEVGDRHSVKYPGREIDSIRRKYNQLHRKQHPTGDPDMPEDVRLAKQVKLKIGAKASIGDATETFTLEEGFPGEDQVLPEEIPLGQSSEDSEADSNNNNKENENPAPTPVKKRPYTRSTAAADTGNNFLKVYQLSCLEEKQARERDREERREERRQEREDRKQERLERERERKQERLERREERDDMMRMFAMAFGANTNTEANIGRKRKL